MTYPISITADAIASLTTAVANTFDGLVPLIALVITVPLVFYIARRVILLFPGRR